MSFGPFSAFYFMFYEILKGCIVKNDPQTYLKKVKRETTDSIRASQTQDISFYGSTLCSMLAGAGAAVITNPFDMAKLRMQVQGAGKIGGGMADFRYKNMFHAIHRIFHEEGGKALFNGSVARVMFQMPMVAITMGIAEFMKPRLWKLYDKTE